MKRFLGILGAVLFGLIVLFLLSYPSVTMKYRMTVEVDVDGTVVSGSSVGRISAGIQPAWLSNYSWVESCNLEEGEAVSVDLGSRGRLWVLLSAGKDSPNATESSHLMCTLVSGAFRRRGLVSDKGYNDSRGFIRYWWTIYRHAEALVLEPDEYPLFVRFRDEADPLTLELVRPDDLAASFGTGVRLRRVTIGITGDTVTRGAQALLPWLADVGRRRLNVLPNQARYADQVTLVQKIQPMDFVDGAFLFNRR